MDMNSFIHDETEVIRLHGKFDFSVQQKVLAFVSNSLTNAATREVKLDLATVHYIDSSALGLLLVFRDLAKKSGKSVSLCNLTGNVKQAVEIANFHKLFVIT